MSENNGLVWLDHATAAIDKVVTLSEAKELTDKAASLKLYAARQKWSTVEKVRIGEIEVRATCRMGELLKDATADGTRLRGRPKRVDGDDTLSLSDLGITRDQSSVAMKAASVPKRQRDAYVAESVAAGIMPTVTHLTRMANVLRNGRARAAERLQTGVAESLESLIEAGDQFGTVYADPPWSYGNQGTRAATDNHYLTMSVDDIAELPVAKLAADTSHLHLWTTNGFLFDAKRVMDAWGFEYKSCFVWVKPQMGIGNYWRVSHEFMLLGVRGACTFDAKDLKSWAEIARGKHSRKPEEVRKMIERASPGPRLELFAREQFEGWTVLGHQVDRGSLYEVVS